MILTPKPSNHDDFYGDEDDNRGEGIDRDNELDYASELEPQGPTVEASTPAAALHVVDLNHKSLPDEGVGMEEDVGILVSVEGIAVLPPDLIVDGLAHPTTDVADVDLVVETDVPWSDSPIIQSDAASVADEVEMVEYEHGAVKKVDNEEDLDKEDTTDDNMHSQSYIVASEDQQGKDEQDQDDVVMEVEGKEESVDSNNDESHRSDDHNGDKHDAFKYSTTSTTANNDDNIDTERVRDEL